MEKIGEPVIPSVVVNTVEDAVAFAEDTGYPVIIRPAFTLGGSGGGIAVDDKEYKTNSTRVSVLIDKMSAEIFADDGTLIHLYEGKFALSGEVKGAEKAYSIKL